MDSRTVTPDDSALAQVLRSSRTIAVLGASARPQRAGFFVPQYLAEHGYRLLPVNPNYVGQELFGRPVVASLADLPADETPIDIVLVFRRSDALPDHTAEVLALEPAPQLVWCQPGASHPAFRADLERRGIVVIEHRCLMVEHRRLVAA